MKNYFINHHYRNSRFTTFIHGTGVLVLFIGFGFFGAGTMNLYNDGFSIFMFLITLCAFLCISIGLVCIYVANKKGREIEERKNQNSINFQIKQIQELERRNEID